MRLTDTGLAVGSTSTSRKLNVVQDSTSAGGIYLYSNAVHTGTDTNALLAVRSDSNNGSNNGDVVNIQGDGVGDLLVLNNNGTDRFTVQADGNVGIGTTSPNLNSFNNAVTLSGTNNAGYELAKGSTLHGALALQGDNRVQLINFQNADLTFNTGTSATERMRVVHSTGNVGIGTSAPEQKLDVNGIAQIKTATSGTRRLRIKDSVTSEYFDIGVAISSSQPNLTFSDGASERMRIDSSGNVGIGTSSPNVKLNVAATTFTPDNTNTSLITEAPAVFSQAQHFYINNAGSYNSSRPTGGIGAINSSNVISLSAGSICTGNPGADGFKAYSTLSSLYDIGNGEHNFKTKSGLTVGDQFTHVTRMIIKDSGNVGIGETAPLGLLHVKSADSGASANSGHNQVIAENSGNSGMTILSGTSSNGAICFGDSDNNCIGYVNYAHNGNHLDFGVSGAERMRVDHNSGARLFLGTTSDLSHGSADNNRLIVSGHSNNGAGVIGFVDTSGNTDATLTANDGSLVITADTQQTASNSSLQFRVDNSEKVRIDSSGNLLVAQTATDQSVVGISLNSNGNITAARDGGISGLFNRKASDGAIVSFRGDGTEVGTINVRSDFAVYEFGSLGTGIGGTSSHSWLPMVSNARSDNTTSLGQASYRMTTIFATTGTINTSDQNEKQSIQSLTTAEMNVGKKLSSLIKTYKWNSSVEEKGDSARTHTGIIAQDVQQAFTDEGLDATKYGLWCSDIWSIDADGEEIENPEEETENNPSKTRLGIRYEQLLSFIQAYNDQRFTELEARITTLEANNP